MHQRARTRCRLSSKILKKYDLDSAHAQACDEDDKRGGLGYIFFAGVTSFGRDLKMSQHPAPGLILWSKKIS